MSTLLAFLVAPACLVAILFLLARLKMPLAIGFDLSKLIALIAYAAATIIGIPFFFVMKVSGFNSYSHYAVLSFFISFLLIALFIVRDEYVESEGNLVGLLERERPLQMIGIVLACFYTVSVFWLIARPDLAAG